MSQVQQATHQESTEVSSLEIHIAVDSDPIAFDGILLWRRIWLAYIWRICGVDQTSSDCYFG